MTRRLVVFLAVLAVICIIGCSDDTTEPEPFGVTVVVTDRSGEPVEGLRASLSPDVDSVIWPHGDKNGRPATPISLSLPVESDFTLEILAVDRSPVWSISDESMPQGHHTVSWPMVDDQGVRVHDGYYRVVVTSAPVGDPESEISVESPLLVVAGSPDVCTVAETDVAGRFEVTDRTYVPAFWALMPINAINEPGEVVGTVEITTATRLVLLSDGGRSLSYVFDAVDGPQTIELEWPF